MGHEDNILKVHYEYFGNQLVSLFQFFNPQWNRQEEWKRPIPVDGKLEGQSPEKKPKKKIYTFLNEAKSSWNQSILS